MQVFEFDNGVVDNKQPTDASFYGLANATPGPSAVSSWYTTAPLTNNVHSFTKPAGVAIEVKELTTGMLRISSDADLGNGSLAGNSTITGVVDVPIPYGGNLNTPLSFAAGVYTDLSTNWKK